MAQWRKPTEEEAQIILKHERRRYFYQRLEVGAVLLVFLFCALFALTLTNRSDIDARTREILGYYPNTNSQLVAMGYYTNAEEVTKIREKRDNEIATAKAQAEKEVNDKSLPYLVGVPTVAAAVYLVYFAITLIPFHYYKNRKYEVLLGEFEDKTIIHIVRNWILYYLVARFEDGSTLEAKTTRGIFRAATAHTPVLVVEVSSKLIGTSDIRAFVLSEPLSDINLQLIP